MSVRTAVAVYYFKYYCRREDLVPVYMAAYFTPVIAGCVLAPVVCRKLGKANAVRHPVLASGALTAALWFARDHATAVMLAGAAGGALTGWLLGAIGFRANMAQDGHTLHWLALVFTVVIGLALMLSVFPMRRYAAAE